MQVYNAIGILNNTGVTAAKILFHSTTSNQAATEQDKNLKFQLNYTVQ